LSVNSCELLIESLGRFSSRNWRRRKLWTEVRTAIKTNTSQQPASPYFSVSAVYLRT